MMPETPTPHDHFFRASITNPRVALEFLQRHLPSKISKLLDLDSLKLHSETFVDEELQKSIADALYSVNFQGKSGYVYFLIEHQSQAQLLMPLRLFEYFIKIFRMHLKKYKTNQLPLIYPFVIYNGEEAYRYTTDFFELFEDPKLAREMIFQPFDLIDLTQVDDNDLKKLPLIGMMEFFLKHARARDLLAESCKTFIKFFIEVAEARNEIELVTTGYYYFLNTQEKKETVFKIFNEVLSEKNKSKVMTIAQQLRQEGRQEGLQEGMTIAQQLRQEGRQEGLQKFRSSLDKQLRRRFPHDVTARHLHFINEADSDMLSLWAEKLMDAESVEEVFAQQC